MKRKKVSNTLRTAIVKQYLSGTPAATLAKKHKISAATIYRWKALNAKLHKTMDRTFTNNGTTLPISSGVRIKSVTVIQNGQPLRLEVDTIKKVARLADGL